MDPETNIRKWILNQRVQQVQQVQPVQQETQQEVQQEIDSFVRPIQRHCPNTRYTNWE